MQLNKKNISNPIKKMGNGPKQILFERGHKEGQETNENMLKVTNHLRDANQNNNAVHLTPVRMAIINKSTNDKYL